MATPAVYLRAIGLLRGEAAAEAVADGWALPLSAREVAFSAAEIWLRGGAGSLRSTVAITRLADWAKQRGVAVERAVAQRVALVTRELTWHPSLPGERPLIMGVVNVTPDSFSDGGRFLAPADAIAEGMRQHAAGADVVDVGGESTRPGAGPVTAGEEIDRVVPVIEALAKNGVLVSIDTRKAGVMQAAITAGAQMINDITALRHDPDSLVVAGGSGLPVVLMHSQGDPATMQQRPHYESALLDVFDHLEERIAAWVGAGFERERLLVDPGIGFGKSLSHNLEILGRLGLYRGLGVPLLLGVSRKSFIARLAGDAPAGERLAGSLAAALAGVAHGVAILRVHDVAATRQALRIWQVLES